MSLGLLTSWCAARTLMAALDIFQVSTLCLHAQLRASSVPSWQRARCLLDQACLAAAALLFAVLLHSAPAERILLAAAP